MPAKTFKDLDGPRRLPFIGNMHQIRLRRLHRILEDWADRYGPLFQMQTGPTNIAVLSDADAIQRVLQDRPDGYSRDSKMWVIADEMDIVSLVTSEGDDWRHQRTCVEAALRAVPYEELFPKLETNVDRLKRRWEISAATGASVDILDDFLRATSDFVADLMFGADLNTLGAEGPPLYHNLVQVESAIRRRIEASMPYWRHFKLPVDRRLDRGVRELHEDMRCVLREAKARVRAESPAAPSNFMESAVILADAGGDALSDEHIITNACIGILEARGTAPYIAGWAIHHFMQYPEHLARARAEVDAAAGPAASAEQISRLGPLPFLTAFAQETMRVKPAASILPLAALEDTEVLGCAIPKGTVVMLLLRHVGLKNSNFGDAAEFNPDRWLREDGDVRHPHNPDAYFPFGAGPRRCPGGHRAMHQVQAVLAMFCAHWAVELARPERPVVERLVLGLRPANLHVRMTRREGNQAH